MKSVVLIVDQYQRFTEAKRSGIPLNAEYEAQTLRLLVKPMGREYRYIALISRDDLDGLNAYQRANYEIITYNGDRPQKIREFLIGFIKQLDEIPPEHLVLVSSDPVFQILCDRASRREDVTFSLWTLSKEIPQELNHSAYNTRPLAELLPTPRARRVDVRLDFENLYRVMEERNWSLNTAVIMKSIKSAISDLGELVRIVAYADWGMLAKYTSRDIQRELTLLGVKTRYQVSLRGKNSADMEIVDDIHRLLKYDHSDESVDVVVIGTCDRDFRPIVETAQSHGKRTVVLGMNGCLSGELKIYAKEIRYLDQYNPLPELINWVTSRIRYCLINKGMPYVDAHYLLKGMVEDIHLQELGVSTDWKTAEQWLDLVIKSKKIEVRKQSHPNNPMKWIMTYWIVNEVITNSANEKQLAHAITSRVMNSQFQLVSA